MDIKLPVSIFADNYEVLVEQLKTFQNVIVSMLVNLQSIAPLHIFFDSDFKIMNSIKARM